MEINFKHPDFIGYVPKPHFVEQEYNKVVTRFEYPDGVIMVVTLFEENVKLSSNKNFILSVENDEPVVLINVKSDNADFKDVI